MQYNEMWLESGNRPFPVQGDEIPAAEEPKVPEPAEESASTLQHLMW